MEWLVRPRQRHARCGGLPQECHFVGRQAVGGVDEVADLLLQALGFGGLLADRGQFARVLFAQGFHAGHGQRFFLAAQFLHFGKEGFFVEVRRRLQLHARLGDFELQPKPVEKRAARRLLLLGKGEKVLPANKPQSRYPMRR